MIEKILIEVYAAIDGDRKGNIATACPVAPGRLLTARHALNLKDDKVQGSIKIRWYHLKGDPAYNWQEAKLIDCGLDPDLDVALLGCTFPEGIEISYPNLLQQPEHGPIAWHSIGFPDVGTLNALREPTALWGNGKSQGDRLELGVDAPVAKEDDWRGASGAPVFIKGRNTIAGVIVTCPKKFAAARLHAVPTWKLFKGSTFEHELAHALVVDWLASLKEEVRWLLSEQPKVVALLAAELKIAKVDQATMDHQLMEKIPMDRVIPAFKRVLDLLCRRNQNDDAVKLRTLLYHLLPLRFDAALLRQVSSSTHAISAVDIGTRSVVEIAMAAYSGRAVEMRQHAGDKVPTGTCFLEQPSESQMSVEDRVDEFTEQLTQRFGDSDALEREQDGSLDALIQYTVSELEYRAEYDHKIYYYIYILPLNQDGHAKSLTF